ncbi:4-alpha-glucanotransferase [bacterium]|nr:4-alpha-glucanotransferase [bacterium]
MQIGKICNYQNNIFSFERRLRPDEERDYRENTLQRAFDYLGTEEVAMIIHGTSYPEDNPNIGIGSPYGKTASMLIPFEMLHGFNSNQLGPVGVIRNAGQISPYKSTVFTKNYLFLDFNELTKDEYANIISPKTLNSVFNKVESNGQNYAYSNFPEAFANYDYCIKIANKNFKQKVAEGNPNALALNEEFKQFKKEKGDIVYKEALFNILAKIYTTEDFLKWDKKDRELINEIKAHNPNAINRYKQLVNRSRDDFDAYIFGQFLIDKQVKNNTKFRKSLGFKYISDLLVGFSKADEWANQDLFLKDYRMGCPDGGEYGPQLWDIPVLDPNKLFNSDGTLGKAGIYLKKKLEAAIQDFDNIRIDHALGLIDPYIYDKNSVVINDGHVDLAKFRANNISNMYDVDPNGNYKRIINEIIIPALKEHGIEKNYPVWEDLCTDTPTFNYIYHDINHLPGITQLEYMRAEQSQDQYDWGLVGSHDSDPAMKMIKKEWIKSHYAWNPLYLAGFLNSNPQRAQKRDEFCQRIAQNDKEWVKAKFAELFLTCKKIQISFADFFGIDKTYNKGGSENNTNWKLRLNQNYEDSYYQNLSSDNPTAINMPEILKIAVQAKADMNVLKRAKELNVSPEELNEKDLEAEQILLNLDKYEKILKEKEL